MTEEMDLQQAGEKAASYFGEGYHCAEAVVAAFFETIGDDAGDAIAHATAFGVKRMRLLRSILRPPPAGRQLGHPG